jgi:hypothetical protein
MENTNISSQIANKAILAALHIHTFQLMKPDKEATKRMAQQEGANARMARVTKQLLDRSGAFGRVTSAPAGFAISIRL